MSTWRELVREEIRALVQATGWHEFTRQALLRRALPRLEAAFPRAKSPGQTMSRVLQEMRRDGEVQFVAPGVYLASGESAARGRAREDVWEGRAPFPRIPVRLPRVVLTRTFQARFRSWVLPNFGNACGACGLSPEWFLDAAHLRPAATHLALAGDPSAGVALCKNHHAALDAGAMVVEPDLTIRVDPRRLEPLVPAARALVVDLDGRKLATPRRPLRPAALPSIPSRPPTRWPDTPK